MATAVIGVGNIGGAVARHLIDGGEPVVLSARDVSKARALASELGDAATAAPIGDAIASAETVVLAIPFDAIRELVDGHAQLIDGKVVVDPSNPLGMDSSGEFVRTLPEGEAAGAVVAAALPEGAHYGKAFSGMLADALAESANRQPERAAILYAAGDERAAAELERLITAMGFEPVGVGGVEDALRIEFGGDLHQFGAFNGQVPSGAEARDAVGAAA